MRVVRVASTAILVLGLGVAAPVFAQQEHQGEKQDHPKQQQGKHKKGKPRQQPDQQQPQRDHEQGRAQPTQPQPRQTQQRPPQGRDNSQQRAGDARHHGDGPQHVQASAWQQHRARSWQSDHRTWQQRGGYHGYRITDDRFHRYFGPEHGFRINRLPFLVVGGYPRFQYQGYWVSVVDPWPESWAGNWYDTDDCYVTYVDNGYYLSNRRHPGVGLAIQISL